MRRNLWAVVGGGLLILGIGLFVTSASPTDFGWFAYTPHDSHVRFPSDVVIMSRGRLIGWSIVVLGLIVMAGGIGYRAGQRRAHTQLGSEG